MFKSFFPRPGLFFTSAVLWTALAIVTWFDGGKSLLTAWLTPAGTLSHALPNNALRFIAPENLAFYLFYFLAVALFAGAWALLSPHPWQRWSVAGSALIIFTTWFSVEVGVAVNAWYGPFFDEIQQALSHPNTLKIATFNDQILGFLSIALIAVVIDVLNVFFISHYIFRWREAMNGWYMARWQQLRSTEGAAQRVQEDTMRFSATMEDMGTGLITAIMTLIAFLPVLVVLSAHVKTLPILGSIPYGLVIAAIIWSLMGTGLLAIIGIKLPGLSFRNQRAEAAYRKELVYGEDDAARAQPPTVKTLFSHVRKSYFTLYFHYLYFNIFRSFYLQIDVVFGLFILFPSIIAGTITLGIMQQIINVFDQVRAAFQYLIGSWKTLVELMSIYKRLRAFERIIDTEKSVQDIAAA